jgi:hypothetical protein
MHAPPNTATFTDDILEDVKAKQPSGTPFNQNNNVNSPQSATPPRSIDHSEGFRAKSLPSLITCANIVVILCSDDLYVKQ